MIASEASATPGLMPSAPQNLQATAGDERVDLTWQAPASDGGAPTSLTLNPGAKLPLPENAFVQEVGEILDVRPNRYNEIVLYNVCKKTFVLLFIVIYTIFTSYVLY